MGITGDGSICAYHKRRLASLMAQRLPMYEMTTNAELEGTTLSTEELADCKI
jgi:hypothetical protein